MIKRSMVFLLISTISLSACVPLVQPPDVQAEVVSDQESTPAATQGPILTPTPAGTPHPFSVEGLQNRTYGNGEFTVEKLWYSYDTFQRYYIIYDSDDLIIHGFVNVPYGDGPHPVIMMLHGYIPADEYTTLDYTTRYADDLAKNGYIVLHPNLRNFPPSSQVGRQRDSNTGYTIDVLNLLAYLRQEAGKEGIFETADVERMGIWGHSIGGSIALRTMSVEPETFKAALLYGAVSQRYGTVLDHNGVYEMTDVDAKISIHHGENDEVISVDQSKRLCQQLQFLGKDPLCDFYEEQPHTFYRDQWADPLLMERALELYDRNVREN